MNQILNTKHTSMYRISSSHQSTFGRRANWLHIIIIQNNSFSCQFINIWCWNLIGSMKSNICPALKNRLYKIFSTGNKSTEVLNQTQKALTKVPILEFKILQDHQQQLKQCLVVDLLSPIQKQIQKGAISKITTSFLAFSS